MPTTPLVAHHGSRRRPAPHCGRSSLSHPPPLPTTSTLCRIPPPPPPPRTISLLSPLYPSPNEKRIHVFLKTKLRHGSHVIRELIASRLFSSSGSDSVLCAQGIQSRIFSPTVQPMEARDRSGHNYAHQVK